jgi:hypothetical protein
MRLWLSLFVLFCGSLSAGDGWIDLFPKGDFKGWTRLPIPPTGKLTEPVQWKLDRKQKLIVCEGTGGHDWMRFDREFTDFLMHVEWRFTPKTSGETKYNSGVFVRNSADGVIWHQAQTGGGNGGYIFGSTPAGGTPQRLNLRDQAAKGAEKPAGEWNVFDIRCEGPVIALKVNGQPSGEFSKSEALKGYIGLEAEGYRIEFRNLRVKPLGKGK